MSHPLRFLLTPLRNLMKRTPASGEPTLVIQPLPGIGDMIWHLPHLHTLADTSPAGRVSVLTKPRSRADKLLAGDERIDAILWLHRKPGRHDGLLGFFRLVAELRRARFARVWILHDSHRYSWACLLAGIPESRGYAQQISLALLSDPIHLRAEQQRQHPTIMGDTLLQAYGLKASADAARLPVCAQAAARVQPMLGSWPKPRVAIGLGSSEACKQWGTANYTALARALLEQTALTVILTGGPDEQAMAGQIAAANPNQGQRLHQAVGLPIDDTVALLAGCQLYLGNDTGFLNICAALQVPAIGLFGASPPLEYSDWIHCLKPGQGSGMAAITLAEVMTLFWQVSRTRGLDIKAGPGDSTA